MNEKMETALSQHVHAEFESAYLYLAMAVHCEAQNLKGFAHWLRVQYQEELMHAMKILDFVQNRGGKVTLTDIKVAHTDFGTVRNVFEEVLAHEKKISQKVNDLYVLAQQEKDYPTAIFLEWFINEQVEEETSAYEILEKIKLVSSCGPHVIFYLDCELKKRQAAAE